MKIVFLCGSLEPGRDGVGDYTRRLAAELIRRGHNASAVGMYDGHVGRVTMGSLETENFDLAVLRIPRRGNDQHRFAEIRKWIDAIDPDWISLQFVPYSFHFKGIPIKFLMHMTNWNPRYSWHIMFHEIWLGMPKGMKENIVSLAQRIIIYRLVAKLRPSVMNVSIPYNQECLKEIGVKANILRLFGNIIPGKSEQPLTPAKDPSSSAMNILYFGKAPRGTFLHKLVKELSSFCKTQAQPVNIIVVAGETNDKDLFVTFLKNSLDGSKGRVIDCGFVDNEAVSLLISCTTVGIARSKPYLLGKSGSAIAMLEHGIPIWLPQWENGSAPQFNFRTHLIFQDLAKAASASRRETYHPLLPEVAETFLYQLQNAHRNEPIYSYSPL